MIWYSLHLVFYFYVYFYLKYIFFCFIFHTDLHRFTLNEKLLEGNNQKNNISHDVFMLFEYRFLLGNQPFAQIQISVFLRHFTSNISVCGSFRLEESSYQFLKELKSFFVSLKSASEDRFEPLKTFWASEANPHSERF